MQKERLNPASLANSMTHMCAATRRWCSTTVRQAPATVFPQLDQRVVLKDRKWRKVMIKLHTNGEQHTVQGVIKHNDILATGYGGSVFTHKGDRPGFVLSGSAHKAKS